MWFFRQNYLNRSDCKKKMDDSKNEVSNGAKIAATNDFKLALQSIYKADNFANFEAQHLN